MNKKKFNLNLNRSSQLDNASYPRRLFAYFIDWYCISVLTILPINLIYAMVFKKKTFTSTLMQLPLKEAVIALFIGAILTFWYLIYIPGTSKKRGQTLGKRLMDIRIVKENKDDVDLKTMIIRNGLIMLFVEGALFTFSIYFHELLNIITKMSISQTSLLGLSAITLASLISAFVTAKRKMLHDFVAHTIVISTKK